MPQPDGKIEGGAPDQMRYAAMVAIEKAAEKLGASVERIQSWADLGLLDVHAAASSGEKLVDEDQLHDVAESLGWLELTQDDWDGE
jgi:hypothetical protein